MATTAMDVHEVERAYMAGGEISGEQADWLLGQARLLHALVDAGHVDEETLQAYDDEVNGESALSRAVASLEARMEGEAEER